jgi:hypothetical protein
MSKSKTINTHLKYRTSKCFASACKKHPADPEHGSVIAGGIRHTSKKEVIRGALQRLPFTMAVISMSPQRWWQYVSVLLLVFLSGSCESIAMQQSTAASRTPRGKSCHMTYPGLGLLTRRERLPMESRIPQLLKMTTEDSTEKGDNKSESEEIETKSPSAPQEKDSNLASYKNSTAKRLLTVPLFLKFVAVLMIKFVTDLVVFPVLFLYRLAHNAKRKVVNLFKKDPGRLNGDKSSS